MSATFRSQFLQLLAAQEADLARLFLQAAMQISYALTQYANASDGAIPVEKQEFARQQVQAILFNLFLVMNAAEGVSAFTVNPLTGAYLPESPFARTIWNTAQQAAELARMEQETLLRRALPIDLLDAYANARLSPFAPNAPLTRQQARLFAAYVPPQNVVYESGRALEDSVIAASTDARRRVRQYLDTMFAEGKSAVEIGVALKDFLTPDKLIPRRNQPYGRSALTLALQIARSLPVMTHSVVGRTLASLNPVITQIRVERGRAVPCPICDAKVKGSPYPVDTPVTNLPGYHPDCLCRMIYEFAPDAFTVIERLRGDDADALTVRGALSPEIIDLLLRSQGYTRL